MFTAMRIIEKEIRFKNRKYYLISANRIGKYIIKYGNEILKCVFNL